VEFVKVDNILTSMLGGKFVLRMHHDVGVVAFLAKNGDTPVEAPGALL